MRISMTRIVLLGALLSLPMNVFADPDGMKGMPTIKAEKTYSVKSMDEGEELQDARGFGDKEPATRMMNLMMVEGSGYEGMDMAAMTKSGTKMSDSSEKASKSSTPASNLNYDAKLSSNPAKVGANTLEITVTGKDGKPVKGLKLKAMVSMTSMDMGTDEAKVRETAPGKYQAKVIFAMQGPWAVKISSGSQEEKIFEFKAEKTTQ
jgi:hypothetical protein